MEGVHLSSLYKETKALVETGVLTDVLPKIGELVRLCKREKKDRKLADIYLMQMQVLQCMGDHEACLNVYNEAKYLVLRTFGAKSAYMAHLFFMHSVALGALDRYDRARVANQKSMDIYHELPNCKELSVRGSLHVARLFMQQEQYEEVLRQTDIVGPLVPVNGPTHVTLLDLRAIALNHLGRIEEAVEIRHNHVDLCKSVFGTKHVYFGFALLDTTELYAQMNQFTRAVPMMEQAVVVLTNSVGDAHPDVVHARERIFWWKQALVDPSVKKRFVMTTLRMCNHTGCYQIEEAMDRCVWCKAHYLCSEHREEIEKHTYLCPKFPQEDVTKCRRCCAESNLLQCSLCNAVSYCTKECQRDDWPRHKQFCTGKLK
jgi:hypothetical protein